LDQKIDSNRTINVAVETLAAAIFKSWFIDFDPVMAKRDCRTPVGVPAEAIDLFPSHFDESELGPIPQGWRVVSLSELAEINARTRSGKELPPEIKYIEISDVNRGDIANARTYAGTEPSRARRNVAHGDTVVSAVRPERGA
jgi:type I restriction enzyme S subunit